MTSVGQPAWDGSDLGKVEAKGTGTIWLPELKLWAVTKASDVERRALVDELRPLFGLMRYGTMQATVGGRRRLVLPLGPDNVLPFRYADLSVEEQKDYHDEVRATLVFREVLGLKPSPLFVAMDETSEAHVTCWPETSWPHRQDWVIKPTVATRYWPKGDYESWGQTYLAKLMTDQFVDQLEEVILRVAPDLLWLRSYIVDRLRLFGIVSR